MKAVVLRRFGGPDALDYIDWPDPKIGPNDVLVKVYAVTVARTLDIEVRQRGANFNVALPRILGSDPAGVVVEVGRDVTNFSLGDRVATNGVLYCGVCEQCSRGRSNACERFRLLGINVDGGDAEYCALPESSVVRIPNHITMDEAASIAIGYPVALNLLKQAAELRPGEDVLVMAAAGALGIAGVLIAKAMGARVIAAAGADWKLERCKALLGADDVVNYTEPDWQRRVMQLSSHGDGVDVVFENISSPELFPLALRSLRPYGRLVTCGTHGGGTIELDMRPVYRSHLSIYGRAGASVDVVREVWRMLAERRVAAPPVFHRFPIAEAPAAHQFAAGRDAFGKTVLIVEEEVAERHAP